MATRRPTLARRASQRDERGFRLYDYNARYYSGLGRFVSPDTVVPEPGSSGGFNRYTYTLNNPLKYIDPSGNCPPSVCRDEHGQPIDDYYRYGDRDLHNSLPLSGLNPWYPVDVPAKPYITPRSPSDGTVIGVELSSGLGKIPGVGKTLNKVIQKTSKGYLAPSSTRGVELVWHRESGKMGVFFNFGASVASGKDVGGGFHGAIYAGDVYNLNSLEDYAHPATVTEFLLDAQTYTRYDGTIAYGPYGATFKHATSNSNSTTVGVAGYAFGRSAQASAQSIKVVPVGDTLHQVADIAGWAVWNAKGPNGALIDIFQGLR